MPRSDAVVPDTVRGPSIVPTLLAGAVIVAALYYGQDLMVPLVLAAFLAFVLAPACALLQKLYLPRVLAVLLAVLLAFGVLGGLGTVVGRQAASLTAGLPTYRTTVVGKWHALTQRFGFIETLSKEMGAPKSRQAAGASGGSADNGAASIPADLGLGGVSGLSLARTVAQPILGPIGTASIVLVFTFFILVSNEDLRDRLVRLIGRGDLHRTILAMNDAAHRLSRFFLFQLALNTTFGVIIGTALWLFGLPNPLLWGILAATMRFVPFIGVFVAAVPPLLLAIAIVPGWSLAVFVLAVFAVGELIMGQVVEPLIYGHNTGLSPIAVIVATAFWALLWGPIGLLIATPLTVCLVVIGRHVEALSFLDVILGDSAPLDPQETFYQRALEGRAATLAVTARKLIAASTLTDYYDRVALPGLALAQGDLVRDDLAFERLEAIHGQIESLLKSLQGPGPVGRQDAAGGDAVDPTWRQEGAVLCIPGRGQLDDLAASMAVHALAQAGFGAAAQSNLVLAKSESDAAALESVRLCCLSVLEQGSTLSAIQYFRRRIRKQMPQATVVVALWHVDRDSDLLRALRAEGGDGHVVLSIGEFVAFAKVLAARTTRQAAARPRERSVS